MIWGKFDYNREGQKQIINKVVIMNFTLHWIFQDQGYCYCFSWQSFLFVEQPWSHSPSARRTTLVSFPFRTSNNLDLILLPHVKQPWFHSPFAHRTTLISFHFSFRTSNNLDHILFHHILPHVKQLWSRSIKVINQDFKLVWTRSFAMSLVLTLS